MRRCSNDGLTSALYDGKLGRRTTILRRIAAGSRPNNQHRSQPNAGICSRRRTHASGQRRTVVSVMFYSRSMRRIVPRFTPSLNMSFDIVTPSPAPGPESSRAGATLQPHARLLRRSDYRLWIFHFFPIKSDIVAGHECGGIMKSEWHTMTVDELFDLHELMSAVLKKKLITKKDLLERQLQKLNQQAKLLPTIKPDLQKNLVVFGSCSCAWKLLPLLATL